MKMRIGRGKILGEEMRRKEKGRKEERGEERERGRKKIG
jgi:hypothetical protein